MQDLRYEMLVAGDAPIEALVAQHTDFDFDHVQPAGVLGDIMELEPAQHPPCFTRGKGVLNSHCDSGPASNPIRLKR